IFAQSSPFTIPAKAGMTESEKPLTLGILTIFTIRDGFFARFPHPFGVIAPVPALAESSDAMRDGRPG
ncbi:MAG TPA: hypothetical protein PL166_15120, partial [Candidatus Contendobacter sp.]|nr:hypothetical protein [Candidatus Contendobacter sp.]